MVDLGERGLRNPQHNFLVHHSPRHLFPIMAAPVRPNETVVGFRLQADSILSRMVKIPWCPPLDVELGVWMFPISSLGDEFTDLFVADMEDLVDPGSVSFGKAGSGVSRPPLPIDEQGPQTQAAHQARNRPWAGEPGQAESDAAIADEALYSPYVSAGTYHIARWFYEMDLESHDVPGRPRGDDDLWQHPPKLGEHTRGATASMVSAGRQDDVIPVTSVSEWAERLSIIGRGDQTYREYLESFGVPKHRIRGMPEPLFVGRRRLRPIGAPQAIGNVLFSAGQSEVKGREGIVNHPMDLFGNDDWRMMGDVAGLQLVGSRWDVTRERRLIASEPSIILGTMAFWVPEFRTENGGHIMDVTRLVHQGLWGPPNPDEIDFVSVQDVRGATAPVGTLTPAHEPTADPFAMEDRDGGGPPFLMNMLNLFLHGDTFSNDPWRFGFYGPGQQHAFPSGPNVAGDGLTNGIDWQVNTIGNLRMGIATDMVQ